MNFTDIACSLGPAVSVAGGGLVLIRQALGKVSAFAKEFPAHVEAINTASSATSEQVTQLSTQLARSTQTIGQLERRIEECTARIVHLTKAQVEATEHLLRTEAAIKPLCEKAHAAGKHAEPEHGGSHHHR